MHAWPHGDPDAVVRGILATAPYRHAPAISRDKPKPTWQELFGQWFHDTIWEPFWHTFRDPIGHALSGISGVSGVIGYVVVGFACLVLAFAIYRLAIALGRPATTGGSASSSAGRLLLADLSSAQLRARAAEAARAGDFGRAIAALFAASLAMLDERGIVAFDRTRTPGEYRLLVRRASPRAAQPFGELSGGFVRAAYAENVMTADDYADAERALADFDPAATTATA